MAYPEIWFAGLTVEQRLIRERRLSECSDVLSLLRDILKNDLTNSFVELRREQNYELPNWQLKTADVLGCQRTLEKTISYLTDR